MRARSCGRVRCHFQCGLCDLFFEFGVTNRLLSSGLWCRRCSHGLTMSILWRGRQVGEEHGKLGEAAARIKAAQVTTPIHSHPPTHKNAVLRWSYQSVSRIRLVSYPTVSRQRSTLCHKAREPSASSASPDTRPRPHLPQTTCRCSRECHLAGGGA